MGATITVQKDHIGYSKTKGNFYADFLKREENSTLYTKLKKRKVIPESFRGTGTGSIKDRLGPRKTRFKRGGPHPKAVGTSVSIHQSSSTSPVVRRTQSVERLVRDPESGKIVPVIKTNFRPRTISQ